MPVDNPEVKVTDKPIVQTRILDGLRNLATGVGTSKDKSTHNVWNHSNRNSDHVSLSARFREDWLSQKIIKIIPEDMTREWRSFESEDAQDIDKEFKVRSIFREAYQWARLYGTAFIVLDIADGRNSDKPVNWNKLKAGCLRSMHVVDRTRIVATGDTIHDPMSLMFGMPEQYQFIGMSKTIHHTRLIRFEGTDLPTYERMRNLWYSDSILIPLTEQIDNFHNANSAAAQMIMEANVDVLKVDGLSNIMQNSQAFSALQSRLVDWKELKSVFGVTLMDRLEEYDQKKMNIHGIKDAAWGLLEIVAASVSIPATRFLSTSPSGLMSSGHSDVVNYADTLSEKQTNIFEPRLMIVDKLMACHYGMEKKDFKYEFNCVFPESIGEAEERKTKKSEGLALLADAGIISRESALQEAIKSGIVSKEATVGDDPNKVNQPIGGKGGTT